MSCTAARSSLEVNGGQLCDWGLKSGLAVLDQGMISGANLVLNILLARWLAPEPYGAFAVAFTCFLFAAGFHNVLLLEPMSVIGPASYAGRLPSYFLSQLKVHSAQATILSALLLLGGLGLAILKPHHPLAHAVIGSGIALPALLLFWLARRMAYVLQRPSTACLASAVNLFLILSGLIWLRRYAMLSTLSPFVLMGLASLLSSLPLLHLAGLSPTRRGGLAAPAWTVVLRENWRYGRWLVGSTILYSTGNQAQTLLVAQLLGLGAAGVLRAMQLPMLAISQFVTAIAVLELPGLSYQYGRDNLEELRRRGVRITAFLTALTGVYAIILVPLSTTAERVLFGGKFSAYAWLIPTLGLIPVFTGFATGFSTVLRALRKPQFDLVANTVAAPVGLASAIVFIGLWGVGGAAASMILSFAASAAVTFLYYRVHVPHTSRVWVLS